MTYYRARFFDITLAKEGEPNPVEVLYSSVSLPHVHFNGIFEQLPGIFGAFLPSFLYLPSFLSLPLLLPAFLPSFIFLCCFLSSILLFLPLHPSLTSFLDILP